MRKDIDIPAVKDVYIAVIKEPSKKNEIDNWAVYIINNSITHLENVIILSEGFSEEKKTSKLRKHIVKLPKKSYAKIEIIHEALFSFTNQFKVTYFKDNTLFDKTFEFKPYSIKKNKFLKLPLLDVHGVLAE